MMSYNNNLSRKKWVISSSKVVNISSNEIFIDLENISEDQNIFSLPIFIYNNSKLLSEIYRKRFREMIKDPNILFVKGLEIYD